MLSTPRKVVRCGPCGLNQYVTTIGSRLREGLAQLPEEREVAASPPVVVPIPRVDVKRIGAVVRDLRLQRGLSQQDLADCAGMQRTYISKIEIEGVNPQLPQIERIARALRVSSFTLLCEPEARLTADPFIAEIAPYVAQLSSDLRSVLLNTIKQLAAKGTL